MQVLQQPLFSKPFCGIPIFASQKSKCHHNVLIAEGFTNPYGEQRLKKCTSKVDSTFEVQFFVFLAYFAFTRIPLSR